MDTNKDNVNITKECLKLNEKVLAQLSTLDPSKVYVFEIETDKLALEDLFKVVIDMRDAMEKYNIKGVYIPTINGIKAINIKELSKYMDGEVKDAI